jgi:hypothetical protein
MDMPAPADDPELLDFATRIFSLARSGGTRALVAYVDASVPADLTNASGDSLLMLAAAIRPPAGTRQTGTPRGGLRRAGRRCAGMSAIAAICIATVTGCSTARQPVAGPTAAATAATTATASATGPVTPAATTSPITPAATTSPTSATSPAAKTSSVSPPPLPTLGRLAGLFARGAGFGQVKPARIFNGGDPTGLVTQIVWGSWGGAHADGTGKSEYVGPGQSVATGTEERASIVAFNLGTCDGKPMYQAVEWYFPQHSQAFDPNQYENICTGAYVGS